MSEINNIETGTNRAERQAVAPKNTETQSVMSQVLGRLGDKIGWKNATSDAAKVADVELLAATLDDDFIVQHHRVRDLMEANEVYSGGYSPADIYRAIEKKGNLPVEIQIGSDVKNVDMSTMVQFMKIKEMNRMMGRYKLQDEKLMKMFFAGEDIKIATEKGEIDIKAKCPVDNLKADFDFGGYMRKIKDNQIGLQFLGQDKDELLKKHHIENGGHAQFVATGKKELSGMTEFLWVPVCETIATMEARSDLPKTGQRFRSAGHVHEVGSFNEDTGTTVKFNKKLLAMHRGEIQTDKVHEETNPRMIKAAVGLGPKEDFTFYKESVERGGKTVEMDVVDIGKKRKGLIYKGLRMTYDQAMMEARGYGLQDDEADDLIMTDIIAPFLLSNSRDWAMCLAKSVASKIPGYSAVMSAQGKEWADFNFCVKIRCRSIKPEHKDKFVVEAQNFYSIKELINYINSRIEIFGDIEGQPIDFKPMSDEERKAQEDDDEEGTEAEKLKTLTPEALSAYNEIFQAIFGDSAGEILKQFYDRDLQAEITVEGVRNTIHAYLGNLLKKADSALILKATGASGDEGMAKIIEFLESLAPEAKKELYEFVKSKTPQKKEQQEQRPQKQNPRKK